MNSGQIIEVVDGGWLELGEGLPPLRVMLARHPAPLAGQDIAGGKRVGEWVYELFLTTLATDGFLLEDGLDVSPGRGAFEAVRASQDMEEDPDRWCSSSECGQERWQMARPLGVEAAPGDFRQRRQAGQIRDRLVGPCQTSSCRVGRRGKRA
jgi:hypothetical protein